MQWQKYKGEAREVAYAMPTLRQLYSSGRKNKKVDKDL
jgi:hypothetical protein